MDRCPLLPVSAAATAKTAPGGPVSIPAEKAHCRRSRSRSRTSWAITLGLSGAAIFLLYLSRAPTVSPPTDLQTAQYSNNTDHDRLFQSIMARMRHATHLSASYCKSSVPTRSTYSPPSSLLKSTHRLKLKKVLVFARHGDRSPQNVLRDDIQSNVTWTCDSAEYTYIHDSAASSSPSSSSSSHRHHDRPLVAKRVNHINSKAAWHPRMWQGTCAQSELTARGRHMHIEFGRALRDVYIDRLGLKHEKAFLAGVRVRATDVGRTLRSAQAVVEGMYPGVKAEKDAFSEGGERKVNIYTLPTEIDPLHSNKLDTQCPRLARIGSTIKSHPLWNTFLRESLHVRALVTAIAPLKSPPSLLLDAQQDAAGKKGVPSVTENLMCRTCWSKPMPCMSGTEVKARFVAHVVEEQRYTVAQAEQVAVRVLAPMMLSAAAGKDEDQICLDAATIESLAQFKAFDFYMRNNWFPNRFARDQIRLELGPLLRETLSVLTSPLSPKLSLFLTHDGTLSGLLGALRVAPEHHSWPAYRSNVVVEVWESKAGSEVVRVLRDGEPVRLDDELSPPCALGDGSCPLQTFIQDLRDRSVEDWEGACLEEE
ncbi:histidine phosphatase superfamily [Catenaria anguillulae PL171]|uniref:Histidine phosphatase superfamily n=1 Tax=Catenaria anguillulae PL171 TaxID=765915 RepID=A0A1Y2I3T9_9FUNG|nr:histidine phosphatase superfamily [Catenaria anguillulae PL171]